jgi:N-methylhydantoinase A/oxoprolinase/acetone carboxylase beta subunit
LNAATASIAVAGCGPGDVGFIGHGSPMATNMVVEGTGAPTALLATRGFRDLICAEPACHPGRPSQTKPGFSKPGLA